jgi:predicted AAA+ superfamily ATPase
MREALVAQGKSLVEAGRFFTIFAPRQSGKTTYFQLLFRQLQAHAYQPVWLTFESLRTLPREKFYRALNQYLQRALAQQGIALDYTITDQFDLQDYLERIRPQAERVVLVIDEFEDVPAEVVSELLHAFRAMYHQRQYYALHALILVGVSTLAELVVSSASPFNIVDQLTIPYFTFVEVENLIAQYVQEQSQPFEPAVIKAIYENTGGQPGLVNGLCQHLVDVVATDRTQPVSMAEFYRTLRYFLTERFDKNILNIVQKAREKQAFVLRVLFDDAPIPFTINEPTIAYLGDMLDQNR